MSSGVDPSFGQRPHPNALPCENCGHVWFEGERRHYYVDEAGEESIEDDATVLCALCKQQRHHPREDEGETYW